MYVVYCGSVFYAMIDSTRSNIVVLLSMHNVVFIIERMVFSEIQKDREDGEVRAIYGHAEQEWEWGLKITIVTTCPCYSVLNTLTEGGMGMGMK